MTVDPLARVSTFLVAVDGSEASMNALAVACGVARQRKARVHALHVIEVPRRLPIDASMDLEAQRGEDVLEAAESIARGYKVKLQAQLVQARQAGHAIVDEAAEVGADVIVVGLDYHRPHGRFQLGRLPEYVLEHAPTEVWLIRYPSVTVTRGSRPHE